MENFKLLFTFSLFLVGMLLLNNVIVIAEPGSEIFSPAESRGEKITKIQFYLHDVLDGANKSVWQVAKSKITNSMVEFGSVIVLDDLLTSRPEMDSQKVGRLQGTVAFADFHEQTIAMLVNIVFTQGEYNGSTISLLGRNPLEQGVREVSIVGGTGAFRLARGYAQMSTLNNDPNYLLIEYNLTVLHYHNGVLFDL